MSVSPVNFKAPRQMRGSYASAISSRQGLPVQTARCGGGCSGGCPQCATTPLSLASLSKALAQASPAPSATGSTDDDLDWKKSGKYPTETPSLSPEEIAELPYPLTPEGQPLPPTITGQVKLIDLKNRNTPEYKDYLEAIPDLEKGERKPGTRLIGFIDPRTNAYYLINNNTGQDIPIEKLIQMVNKSDFLATQIQGVINHEFSHKNHMERYVKDDRIDKWYVSVVINIDGSPQTPQYGVSTWGFSIVDPGLDQIVEDIQQGQAEITQRLPRELKGAQERFLQLRQQSKEKAAQFLLEFKRYLIGLLSTLQDWAARLPILQKEAREVMVAAFAPLVLRNTHLKDHADGTISPEDLESYRHAKGLVDTIGQLLQQDANLQAAVQQGLAMVQAGGQQLQTA